jgi:hypothetical protein
MLTVSSTTDSLTLPQDSILRIRNLSPFFTLHVDSTMSYNLEVNKNPSDYYWYLKNSPLGLKINKDNGLLTFKADKSYFLSGRLKYDFPYRVSVGVQNLKNPSERVDTTFIIQFYHWKLFHQTKTIVQAVLSIN